MKRVFDSLVDDQDGTDAAVSQLAETSNATPESVAGVVNHILADGMDGATKYIERKFGEKVDPDDFTDYAFKNFKPARLKSLLFSIYTNNLKDVENAYFAYRSGDRG